MRDILREAVLIRGQSAEKKIWKTLNRVNLTVGKIKYGEAERPTPFVLSVSVPPGTESDFWPTPPSREQRGYQKSDPGGDHYYVGCLDQTRVSLSEYLISDHRHIMVRAFF